MTRVDFSGYIWMNWPALVGSGFSKDCQPLLSINRYNWVLWNFPGKLIDLWFNWMIPSTLFQYCSTFFMAEAIRRCPSMSSKLQRALERYFKDWNPLQRNSAATCPTSMVEASPLLRVFFVYLMRAELRSSNVVRPQKQQDVFGNRPVVRRCI